MPLRLWCLGRYHRGKMLAVGWTPAQYERRIFRISVADIMLTLAPQTAIDDEKEQRAEPWSPFHGGMADAPGTPIL